MSNDRQRVKRAIQRIAESSPDIRSLLKDAQNKGGKPGSAGVGGGAGSEEGSNTINETRICCDGSTGDPNPGVDERETGNDQNELDPDNPADIDLSGGCLTGVTNCATGEAICFCGEDFIPPDATSTSNQWNDPGEPPPVFSYEEGYYYDYQPTGCPSFFALAACQAVQQFYASSCNSTATSFEYISGYAVIDESISEYSCYADLRGISDGSVLSDVRHSMFKRNCSYEPNAVCEEDPPLEAEWPSDSCVNLAIKNGTIVGSKYDPENDGSYSAPMSEIQLCHGANQTSLKPSGSNPGGYKTIDAINGGDGYLYNSQHEQIARISGDEYSDPAI